MPAARRRDVAPLAATARAALAARTLPRSGHKARPGGGEPGQTDAHAPVSRAIRRRPLYLTARGGGRCTSTRRPTRSCSTACPTSSSTRRPCPRSRTRPLADTRLRVYADAGVEASRRGRRRADPCRILDSPSPASASRHVLIAVHRLCQHLALSYNCGRRFRLTAQ